MGICCTLGGGGISPGEGIPWTSMGCCENGTSGGAIMSGGMPSDMMDESIAGRVIMGPLGGGIIGTLGGGGGPLNG